MNRVLLTLASTLALPAAAATIAPFECGEVHSQKIENTLKPVDYPTIRARAGRGPLVVHVGGPENAQELRLVVCSDAACTQYTQRSLDHIYNYFNQPVLMIDDLGRAGIYAAYYGGNRYYACGDANCTYLLGSTIIQQPAHGGYVHTAAMRSNGLPVLVYDNEPYVTDGRDLIARFCDDRACTTGTNKRLIDVGAANPLYMYEAEARMDSQDRLTISYIEPQGGDFSTSLYKILKCDDSACNTVTISTVSGPTGGTDGTVPRRTSLAIRADDHPVALDSQLQRNVVINCADLDCAISDGSPLPAALLAATEDVVLGPADRPILSANYANGAGFYFCADETCASGERVAATTPTQTSTRVGMATDAAGLPLMAFAEGNTQELYVSTCTRADAVFKDEFE